MSRVRMLRKVGNVEYDSIELVQKVAYLQV